MLPVQALAISACLCIITFHPMLNKRRFTCNQESSNLHLRKSFEGNKVSLFPHDQGSRIKSFLTQLTQQVFSLVYIYESLSIERSVIARKGGFPLSRNFYVRKLIKKGAIHERPRVKVKVEPRVFYVRTHKKITRQSKSTFRVNIHSRVISICVHA